MVYLIVQYNVNIKYQKKVIKSEQIINVDRMEQAVSLFGSFDENILLIRKAFNVDVIIPHIPRIHNSTG